MATTILRLSRKWGGLTFRTREWQIVIDGNVVGSIANDETVEVPIEPGRHTLRLSSRWHSSPERSFDATEGEMVSFSCRAAMFWPQYVAALIKPTLWISLKRN